jgi:hypothetical protein
VLFAAGIQAKALGQISDAWLRAGVHVVSRPRSRMNGPNNVRVVLGVRSSAHYPVPATEPGGQWGVFRIPAVGKSIQIDPNEIIPLQYTLWIYFDILKYLKYPFLGQNAGKL